MNYRIIQPPGIANHEIANYAANAVQAAEERRLAEEARIKAHRDREAQIAANLAQIAADNKAKAEKAEKLKAEREAASFDAAIRAAFFEANTGATEADFNRNKTALRDEALRQRTLGAFEGRESLVKRNVEILRRRGIYQI